jgi:murein endopeptidase
VRLAPLAILIVIALPVALFALTRSPDRRTERPAAPTVTTAPSPVPSPVPTAAPQPEPTPLPRTRRPPARAVGLPYAGRLVNGHPLPVRGPGFETWDPIRKQVPNRGWRRWGTGRLVRTVERVVAAYARRHPNAAPVLVGDLSRPRGGDFGPQFGGIGHASHQNGLDVDVYYPRRDGRVRAPRRPDQVDRAAAQELVDAFVRAGAQRVFVGPSLGLRGPPRVVQVLVNHDDHLHARLPG